MPRTTLAVLMAVVALVLASTAGGADPSADEAVIRGIDTT